MKLGLIGHPVSHSLSPPMHRAALLFFGINGSYDKFDVAPEQLLEKIEWLKSEGLLGFNITIPHKETVFQLSDLRSIEAKIVGAANTVKFDSSGRMLLHNTDLAGFIRALRYVLRQQNQSANEQANETDEAYEADFDICKMPVSDIGGKPVLVLGAGGAARACIAGLILQGCQNIVLGARRLAEARLLCDSVSAAIFQHIELASHLEVLPFEKLSSSEPFSLIVNCTPIGLTELELPSWADDLFARANKNAVLFDNVYDRNAQATLMMRAASAHGLLAVDGLRMLAEQAALAFEFWTAKRPSTQLMLDAINNHINSISDESKF